MTGEVISVLAFGDDNRPYHEFDWAGPTMQEFLEQVDGLSVDLTADHTVLESGLDDYDCFVSYHPSPRTSEWSFTEGQLDGLEAFVRDGNGFVPLHAATAFAEDNPLHDRQARLIGGSFVEHGDPTTISVEITNRDHPVTAGIESFEIHDEPYKLRPDPDVDVLATVDHESIGESPVCWTKTEGDGRICYYSNGHDEESFATPQFRRIVTNAVTWAAAEAR
jgi:hypothetical protein